MWGLTEALPNARTTTPDLIRHDLRPEADNSTASSYWQRWHGLAARDVTLTRCENFLRQQF